MLLVHDSDPEHVPQLSVPPQPSGAVPQVKPWPVHVSGAQPPQVPPLQAMPPLHVLPGVQHGCPWPPHAAHVPLEQTSPVAHALFALEEAAEALKREIVAASLVPGASVSVVA